MPSPPYNYDITNPSATGTTSAFPVNEQAFRATVASAVGTVVDATTGLGPIVKTYTSTTLAALVNPPTGLLVFNSTANSLQMNTGTPASPVFTSVA
jgi:hypothetical protein